MNLGTHSPKPAANTFYVLTGTTGFIGSEVLARLVTNVRPEQIILLGRRKPEAGRGLLWLRFREHGLDFETTFQRIHFVNSDFGNPDLFRKSLEDVKALMPAHANFRLLHMAALIQPLSDKEASIQSRINIGVTQDLLNWAASRNAEAFLYLSSMVAWGGSRMPVVRTEKDYTNFPKESRSFDYFRTKRVAHDWLLANAKIPLVLLCPGIVHGAFEHFKSSRAHLLKLRNGELKFAPPGGGNFVGLDRVSGCIVQRLLQKETYKDVVTQLLVDRNMTYKDYFQLYVDLARPKEKTRIRLVPGWLAGFAIGFCHTARMLRLKAPHVLAGLAQASFYLWFESELALTPTEGLEQNIKAALNSETEGGWS